MDIKIYSNRSPITDRSIIHSMQLISADAFGMAPWYLKNPFGDTLQQLVTGQHCYYFIAKFDNKPQIIGFGLLSILCPENAILLRIPKRFRTNQTTTHLTWSAVNPIYWKMGIGGKILKSRIECATSLGSERIYVSTLSTNLVVLKQLRKLGFSICDREITMTSSGPSTTFYLVRDLT